MPSRLTQEPDGGRTFLDFPFASDLDRLDANIAILGVPFGMPYANAPAINDQSRAPDAIRQASQMPVYAREKFDWDLNGTLLDNRDIKVVDCGNVTTDPGDPKEHYRRAQAAARKIFKTGATLLTLGGDHGIPIPIMRALEGIAGAVTLIHIDAHLDWRDEAYGEKEGFRSPVRRASEMPWISKIIQIGIRGTGSLDTAEVTEARAGADIITAYELHAIGMAAVLDRIPAAGPYYVSIDADAMDPSIMPGVMSPSPGGLTWLQLHQFIHGLAGKGRILGMDLVEIAPGRDVGGLTLVHAERLLCNFIGACVRAGYYG